MSVAYLHLLSCKEMGCSSNCLRAAGKLDMHIQMDFKVCNGHKVGSVCVCVCVHCIVTMVIPLENL